ncbi:uncharacterized protein LOC113850608 [Abrus precatorius]|uniref:Uncharacterized protein LOC113850608 n=1 Tax=Abrus precatorius TaxID=3816 RepID=A0A8B8K030_ABRPR|nr:uncharacterized protein LOC113850608 [Abrus precatorius]
MAKPHPAAALLLLFLLLTSSFSYARPFNSFNLALPSDRVLPVEEYPAGHMSPSHRMEVADKIPLPGMRVGRKYGAMVLNMLPKGSVPPSGPSKGSNYIKN